MNFDLSVEGEFGWHELRTNDIKGAKVFYGELFDWDFKQYKASNGEEYTLISFEDDDDSFGKIKSIDANEQSHWGNYLTVYNLEDVLEEVEELGGKIIVPRTNIVDVGDFAVIQDPQGAVISLMELIDEEEDEEDE